MGNKRPLNDTKTKVLTITGKRLLIRIEHDLAIVVNGKRPRQLSRDRNLELTI